MDFIATLDSELAAFLRTLPTESSTESGDFSQDLPGIRAWHDNMMAALTAGLPDSPLVTKEDHNVPGLESAPEVPIRVYRPTAATAPVAALLWMHGGGMIAGTIAMDDHQIQHVVETVGCLVASVEYRLAPEHPFPAALEDCYAALKWTYDHGGEFGIDVSRIAVGGGSAGGLLAAALALFARDRGEVPIAFQWLMYPNLDDRNITPSSHAITDPRVVNRAFCLNVWRAYLGAEPGNDDVSPYAAPSRATDLSNLPSAYIQVGSQDLFVDEDADYAQRLARAGVLVELHVYPGAFHASERAVPAAALSQRMVADQIEALKRALQPALTRPPKDLTA